MNVEESVDHAQHRVMTNQSNSNLEETWIPIVLAKVEQNGPDLKDLYNM